MSTYKRNVLVGATVLAAFVMLGWMIIRFGGDIGSLFAGEVMTVRFKSDRADGISPGSGVIYPGVAIGRVTKVTRDPNLRDIWIEGTIEAQPPLPEKLVGTIRQTSLLGSGASIILSPAGAIAGQLKPNAEVPLNYAGLDLFPPELKELSGQVAAFAKEMREANVVGKMNKVLDEATTTIANINKFAGDESVRKDVRASIDNIKTASDNVRELTVSADKIVKEFEASLAKVSTTADAATDTVKTTQARIDEIAKSAVDRLAETSKLLDQVNTVTAKINDGQGTAGKLVNDPKLYEGLVDTTTQLNATVKDLQRLIQQWEQEGVALKLR